MRTCIYCGKECDSVIWPKYKKESYVEISAHRECYHKNPLMKDKEFIIFLWDILNNVLFQGISVNQDELDIIQQQMLMRGKDIGI